VNKERRERNPANLPYAQLETDEPLMEIISAIGINKEPSFCLLINVAVLIITHTFWFMMSRSLFFNRYF
jgi:hypothetical protein